MGVGGCGGRFGVAALLAFVEVDDAFEAVVGVERARAGQSRGVALDAQAQLDDGVDVGMGGGRVDQVGDGVASLAAGHVDGIVAAPSRREHAVDGVAQVPWQGQQGEVGVPGHGIGGDDTPAAGSGQHQDPVAGGQRLGGDGGGGFDGLLVGGGPHLAGRAGHPVEHPVVAGQRTGVRGCRPLPTRGGPALDDDDRHPAGDLPDPFVEAPAVNQALHVAEGHVGLGIVGKPLEVVGDAGRGGVAGRHGPADPHPGLAGVVLEGGDEVARLGGDRDTAPGRVGGDDLGAQPGRRRHHALAVGARQDQAQLVDEGDHGCFGRRPFGSGLGVSAGDHEHRPDTPGCRGPDQRLVGGGRRAHHEQIGGPVGHLVD